MPQAKSREKAGKLAVNKASSRDEAVLNEGGLRCDSVLWDFSEDAGAADAAISLGRKLPEGAIALRLWTDEQTAVTGATDCDLQIGSTALNTAAIDFTGDAGIQSRGATPYKVAAGGEEISVIFNSSAATAGKVRFFVEYVLPND
jgi:hypothetical protein